MLAPGNVTADFSKVQFLAAGRNTAASKPALEELGNVVPIAALTLAEQIRDNVPDLRLVVDAGHGSFKAKLKRADRSNARFAIILGEDEVEGSTVGVKNLRAEIPQTTMAQSELAAYLQTQVAESFSQK